MTAKLLKISKCKLIKNPKGNIIKFVNKNDVFFKKFGELYFSEIKKNKTKGWNFHKKYTCLMTVPYGKVKFKTFNFKNRKMQNFLLSAENKVILQIPPQFWFSFTSLVKKSIVVNILDYIHDPKESKKSLLINNISIK